jgi:cyclohexyl-isocyanide hydratase
MGQVPENRSMTQPFTVVIPIYPRVTHLDFTGPHQVLAFTPGVNVIVASAGCGEGGGGVSAGGAAVGGRGAVDAAR